MSYFIIPKINNIIAEMGHADYCSGHGMSWGKYNLGSSS